MIPAGRAGRFPVVALVGSAGGLAALSQVLGALPADLPASVLVALHLEPNRTSQLTAILAGRTALRVTEAVDDAELTPGTVLVVPAGRHLLVTSASRIGLLDTGALPPRPSADLLLATLAVTCGPRALAVVLTGKGTDAQAGIRAVVRCGGTVLAQDEATSTEFGMPGAAIGTELVDAVLPLPAIAGAIQDHVGRYSTRPSGFAPLDEGYPP
ncbi:chemotaxis protein CheB [Amycolatopsis sp. cg9]|uniref:chemotaxis protein CheB n=1 Tax=Amycolatopsis sp. cg9 TaxID=3238801 RepID=UPI003524D135